MNEQENQATAQPLMQNPIVAGPLPSSSPSSNSAVDSAFALNSFVIEDSFYRARIHRPVHWSVAWSDLMMTMFILFLTMFVYQASHEEFLVSNTPEIIGGSTTEAIESMTDGDLIVPIVPLKRAAPLISSGVVKKVEKVIVNELDIDNVFIGNTVYVEPEEKVESDNTAATAPKPSVDFAPGQTSPNEDILEPAPLATSPKAELNTKKTNTFEEIYDLSRDELSKSSLGKFASLELVPEKTMRIILTSDLLFYTGQADLSSKARTSLKKLTAIIKNTPYMVNVVGHTDNQPMHSSRFATNWELSVVRASSVARFLIEDMEMNPAQFIVSGYGSNRPIRPNTNVENRSLNRRVEIIISKRLAPAVKASPNNLL